MATEGPRGAWLIGLAASLIVGAVAVIDLSPAHARGGGFHGGYGHGYYGGYGHGFHGGDPYGYYGGYPQGTYPYYSRYSRCGCYDAYGVGISAFCR